MVKSVPCPASSLSGNSTGLDWTELTGLLVFSLAQPVKLFSQVNNLGLAENLGNPGSSQTPLGLPGPSWTQVGVGGWREFI